MRIAVESGNMRPPAVPSSSIQPTLRGLVLMLIAALTMIGCQPAGLGARPKPATPEIIALQPGDVAGLQRCGVSGNVASVLNDERANNPPAYDLNATEWEQWRQQGASDGYFAVYGRSASDCQSLSASSTGEPTGLMVALIVSFKTEARAQRNFGLQSTLLGFGPGDINFIRLVGGSVTTGAQTGLGPQSVIGTGAVTGATYYFAFWQNKAFDSFLVAYDLASSDARVAVDDVNRRIH